LLTRTASRLSGSARARVLIESAYTAAFACQSAESLRLARDAMDAAGPALELRVQALAVAALAWTIGGHSTLALRAAETAGPRVADVIARDPYPGNAVMVLLPAQCMALIAQGRIVEAAALAESALDGAESLRATALSLRGRVALVEGRLAVAESSGLEVLRDTGWGPAAQWPTAIVTAAAAQRGSPETAASFADRPSPGDPQVPLYLHELTVARGWLAAAQGDVAAGLAQIRDAAEVAAGRGAWLLEMLALVDIVRLGAPSSAAARLAALCDLVEGAFVVAAAAYAQAAAAEDGEALDEVSLRYETMGALLLAAESAADASAAHRTAGSRTRDRNSRARALSLAARCEGPRTPALRLGDADPLVTQLTRREREVMELAARGLTNREIAEHLYVSIRTVNAHLNHVYGKLGLNDRTQLSGLVPPPPH
jgi:DNA-binding CsgD family transcriptional regulator